MGELHVQRQVSARLGKGKNTFCADCMWGCFYQSGRFQTASYSRSSPAQKVASPRSPYSRAPSNRASPLKPKSPEDRSSQDEETQNRPLMHTVSFYRRQQSAVGKR